MALHHRVAAQLRPWHALMLAVFLAGTALQLTRGLDPLSAALSGLFGLVIFQFTVGNVWAAAVEYRNAGGRWRDLPFLVPIGLAAFAATTLYAVSENVAVAASAAFWVFVGATAVTAVVVNLVVGYHQGDSDASQRVE
ncbi:hypothetical protein [Halobaculum limi]|uniref:hypothetical protein n=1 Tax=Halobaculum limi TaxID=3031916 RepID=UPI0024063B1E|nr:hypothetical protein [Halobaculum sp. YSMS11]